MDLKEKIYNLLKEKESVFVVGARDAGKSWFVENELLPFLRGKNFDVKYFSDGDHLSAAEILGDGVIVDEMETLQDRNFLETAHPEERPYYSDEYLAKVKTWFEKLKSIKLPTVYIITRNNQEEIQNLIQTVKTADWDNRAVECVEFVKQ
ncbi:MAG: hypothetical protein PHT40_04470 [Patescibacteria group bacterium]|nr:hypothetical protein [Patescibacteria group bacterium]